MYFDWMTPIEIKAEETANIYRIIKDSKNHQLDHEVEQRDLTHPADIITIREQNELKNTRSKYSQTEARLNKESYQKPLYTYRKS